MSGSSDDDTAARAKAALTAAHEGLVAGSKVAIGDDGRTLLMAAAAVDLAIEHLTPPAADLVSAAASCREAGDLVGTTRAYAPGGTIALVLDAGRRNLDEALKLLR